MAKKLLARKNVFDDAMKRSKRSLLEALPEIIESLLAGCNRVTAVSLAGFPPKSFRAMFDIGKAECEMWSELIAEGMDPDKWKMSSNATTYLAVIRAESIYKSEQIAQINRHARLDWKASKWMLETAYPNEFGNKLDQEVLNTMKLILLAPATANSEDEWMRQNVIDSTAVEIE